MFSTILAGVVFCVLRRESTAEIKTSVQEAHGCRVFYRGYIGLYIGTMEKKMETIIMGYVGFSGIMEKRMETTIV